MNRRDCLTLAGAAVTAAGCQDLRRLADPRPERSGPALVDDPLLRRATFGPSRRDAERIRAIGRAAWIDEQLEAPADDSGETLALRWRTRVEAATENPYELRDLSQSQLLSQLQKTALLRATYSPWQLRERMVDFWSNHFNIYARKVFTARRERAAAELMYLIGRDQRDVIRPHALGNFGAMLQASMHSPAMLGYLDNQVSRKGAPNENYARELMELHTLGVGGGYTQKDVKEVARCLTGWTIEDGFLKKAGTLVFDRHRHDFGEKTVLGVRIPAGGAESDADRVREILLAHGATGRFLGKKLVRYFYGEGEAAGILAEKVASAYRQTRGEIPAMLKALLLAPEFASAPPVLKRPFDYLVSALRATNALTDGADGIQKHLAAMGQPLFQWPMPDGFPDRTVAWTGSLLARWNFALALATGGIPGTAAEDPKAVAEVSSWIDGVSLHGPERLALALAAPAFQWK